MEWKPSNWQRPKWLPTLHDPAPPRLWRIGYALAVSFAVAAAGLAALWQAALVMLNHPHLPHGKLISLHDTVGVAQLVFASVAGAGALVALVVAYRRQRVAEAASTHDRTRVLNERFTTIAGQLGDDQAAVRLAGVHAMAGLADDWEENRQTCIDVLCAYLRLPYKPEPGDQADAADRLAFRASREVRHTLIRVITQHLRKDAPVSWQGRNFDFTGVAFDGGDFSGAVFSGGDVSFDGAVFSCYWVSFVGAVFSGGQVSFHEAEFSGSQVSFLWAEFSGSQVNFNRAKFSGGKVGFNSARFSGGRTTFIRAAFSSAQVDFLRAEFSSGEVRFNEAEFSGGQVNFFATRFSGGTVDFSGARFSGGTVDFSCIADWSHPPRFPWEGIPPAGVKLPERLAAGKP